MKRSLIISLALIVLILVPVACSQPAPAPAPAPGVVIETPPAPMPAPAPRPAPAPSEIQTSKGGTADSGFAISTGNGVEELLSADRMIVYTGNMALVVDDIVNSIDGISALAENLGGYVVSSSSWRDGERLVGQIAIRVLAEHFDEAIKALRSHAVEVISETTSSKDVTEEYVDLSAKLKNLEATEERLLEILKKAETVEEILEVENQLSSVRGEIERTKGRIQYLERSSDTALIEVRLEQAGLEVKITADRARIEEKTDIRFISQVAGGFAPYNMEWDFGDGNTSTDENPVHAYKAEGKYTVSLTVTDDRGNTDTEVRKDYIVVVQIALEAKFSVDEPRVKEKETIRFTSQVAGGIAPYEFEWDFGDDSTSDAQNPAHSYKTGGRYTVTLTVTDNRGNIDTEVRNNYIFVEEGWKAIDTARNAWNGLVTILQLLAGLLIWIGYLIPLWIIIGGIVYLIIRWRRWRRSKA